jgi:uncharacterized OB-fold protein
MIFVFSSNPALRIMERADQQSSESLPMMNCPKCGAGNKPGAESCRMCAEPLGQIGTADSVVTEIHPRLSTDILPDLKTQVGTLILREKLLCSFCSASNEMEWLFCQQCGKKLDKLSLQPAPAAGADIRQTPQPAPSEKVADGPQIAVEHSRKQSFLLPEQPLSNFDADLQQSTVVLPVLMESMDTPAQPQEPVTDQAPVNASVKGSVAGDPQGVVCSLCGQSGVPESLYCSACGAPRTVAETVVMQSLPKPVQGRLRLIFDSGDSDVFYDLNEDTLIGRRQGDITFAHDGFMSDTHARIVRRGDDYILIDEGSRNGIYIRIKEPRKLDRGDYILIGRQVFQFDV